MTALLDLLRGLAPSLDPKCYRFRCVGAAPPGLEPNVLMAFREDEGWTTIVEADPTEPPPLFRRIVLSVVSDLEDVGLTAAVSRALGDAGIPANVVAAYHHDHVFVPAARAADALAALAALSRRAAEPASGR